MNFFILHTSSFILHPSYFILHTSSFILHTSYFILHTSYFILHTFQMRILATIRLAIRALRRNKLRSILTMLGIIIGVGSVIAAVSITTGATKQVEDKVSALGQNVITVFSGNFTMGGMRGGWGSAPTLTVEDALAIKNEVANVVA